MIRLETDGAIARLTLDRPGALNALDRALTMPRQERWARHNRLWQRIETYDLANWRDSFIQSFAESDTDPVNLFPKKVGAA